MHIAQGGLTTTAFTFSDALNYLDRTHIQGLEALLYLDKQVGGHGHVVRLELLHVLVLLEAAGEGLDDPEVVELAHQRQRAGLAGRLLVAARLTGVKVPAQLLNKPKVRKGVKKTFANRWGREIDPPFT